MTILADPPTVVPEPEAPAATTRGPRQALSWLRGWRVPLRLARRDVRRRPGRTLLVALLVALPVTSLVLIDVSYRTTQAKRNESIPRQFGTADAIASVAADAAECSDCASRADIEAALPEGTRQLWSTQAGIPLRTPEQMVGLDVIVANTDPSDPLNRGVYSLAEGRWPAADNEVAMDRKLANYLGVALGDDFSLAYQTRTFRLVGLTGRDSWRLVHLFAPGFDFSVVRPSRVSYVGAFDLPTSFDAAAALGAGSMGNFGYGELLVRPGSNGTPLYGVAKQAAVDQSVVLGWLGGVLAMSVLGVVIAAAFAISGRRQLITVGQLSASGAGQRTLTRTFGLYGAVTAVVGVAGGLVSAVVLRVGWPQWFRSSQDPVVLWLDILVISATAIGVATAAALAPTRSLTRVSVLSALAGRRPVGAVPRWLSRVGAALFAGGLAVALIATRSGAEGGGREAGMLVALGVLAAVLGTCALAPVIVDHFGALASRRGGSMRLAARSVTRHRPRAAAVLASLLVVGMASAGGAAVAEQRIQENDAESAYNWSPRSDLVWAQSFSPSVLGDLVVPPQPLFDPAVQQADAESAIGPVVWTPAAMAYQPVAVDPLVAGQLALVATDQVLDLLGVSEESRQAIAAAGGPVLLNRWDFSEPGISSLYVPELQFQPWWPVISPSASEAEGWVVVPQVVMFGVTARALTVDDADSLSLLSSANSEAVAYLGLDESQPFTQWSFSNVERSNTVRSVTSGEVRLTLVGVTLLLVMLLVSIGMALWAVESRDDRDVLVAVGASPSTMARIAGWRAGGLTFVAMVIAVPMGIGVAWAVARAAHGSIAVPWLLAALLVGAVPAVIGVGAVACSALAQRVRPVRMSTLTCD